MKMQENAQGQNTAPNILENGESVILEVMIWLEEWTGRERF